MGQSPLIIESYHLRKLEYELKDEFEFVSPEDLPDSVDPKIEVSVESGKNSENENDWRVAVNVSGGDEPDFPYTFSASFVGYFRVADGFPEDKRALLVTVNGPSILFAAAREFIAIVTSRSPYPPIMLPSISFVPDDSDVKKAKRKQPSKPVAKKPVAKKPAKKAQAKKPA